ncbi:hypothetical protein BH10PSE3_BH10PSE3_40170 [soil metagenome]
MMPQLTALLPKDKLDTAAIGRLSQAGYPVIEPLLAKLLTWMQDLNWPVAQELRLFLADIGAPLAPHIRAVLQTDDEAWKYWTVIGVVAESNPLSLMLRPERLASSPTDGEREERIDLVARNILRRLETGSDESVLPDEYKAHNRRVLGET